MVHFRSASIFEEARKQQGIWKVLIEEALSGKIVLPHPSIKVFDENGERQDTIKKGLWDAPEEAEPDQNVIEQDDNTEQEEDEEEEGVDWIEPVEVEEFPLSLTQIDQCHQLLADKVTVDSEKKDTDSSSESGMEGSVQIVTNTDVSSGIQRTNYLDGADQMSNTNKNDRERDELQQDETPKQVPTPSSSQLYQTSLVRAISSVLPVSNKTDLEKLDKVRVAWKKDTNNKTKEEQFRKQLAVVSTKLLKKYTALKDKNNNWEKRSF